VTGVAPGRVLPPPAPASLTLAVVAAHQTGQALHPRLVVLGGRFVRLAVTAPFYRLVALGGRDVERGGLWWAGVDGDSVEVELHDLPLSGVGALVALLPAPLAVGGLPSPTARRSVDSSAPTVRRTPSTSRRTAAGRASGGAEVRRARLLRAGAGAEGGRIWP